MLSSTDEAETTTNASNYRGRVLSAGEYNVTLMVINSRGAFDGKVVTFHIDDDTSPAPDDGDTTSLSIKSVKKTYLQGTDITGAMLSTQVQIYDKISGEILTYIYYHTLHHCLLYLEYKYYFFTLLSSLLRLV